MRAGGGGGDGRGGRGRELGEGGTGGRTARGASLYYSLLYCPTGETLEDELLHDHLAVLGLELDLINTIGGGGGGEGEGGGWGVAIYIMR